MCKCKDCKCCGCCPFIAHLVKPYVWAWKVIMKLIGVIK